MIVDQVSHECKGATCELSARVRSEAWSCEEFTLWYRVPAEHAAGHTNPPDSSPFVAALLLWCMRRDEPLAIDGPVSPRLLDSVPKLNDVLHAFWPDILTPAVVEAQRGEPSGSPPTPTGRTVAFFTCGVDSWYTASTYGERPCDRGTLTDLVYVPSIDFMYDEEHLQRAIRATEEAAHSIGKGFVVIETNLRRHTERFLHWGHYHGAGFASMGLALGADRVLIAGPRSFGWLAPDGAHPLLDWLWSTETTEIVHHGAHSTRWDKILALASAPEKLATLKVCFDENTDGNCGRCPKCVATMVQLSGAGLLAACPFDIPLQLKLVAGLELSDMAFDMLRSQVLPNLEGPLRRALVTALVRARLRALVAEGRSALKRRR